MNSFLKRWLSESIRVPARGRKLHVEHLEDRTTPTTTIPDVLDTQPAAKLIGTPTTIAGGVTGTAPNQTITTANAPQTVVNPIRSNQIVTAFVSSTVGVIGSTIAFRVSNDFGQTWQSQSSGITLRNDPLTYNGPGDSFTPYLFADSPSIAFGRTDNFYVAYIQRNAADTSGLLRVEKFSIKADGTIRNLSTTLNPNLTASTANDANDLYRWVNQDPVFNPAVGVNADATTYTDPTTGQTQTDPTAGRGVYVAWNTNATQTGFTTSLNTYTIQPVAVFAAVSDDGGVSYSAPQAVSNNASGSGFGRLAPRALNPTISFTPSAVGTPGGTLGVYYNNGSGIVADVTNPFAGNATAVNPLTAQQTVSYNGNRTINGANPAASPAPATARTTTFTQAVTIDTSNGFGSLADLDVTLGVYSQDLGQMKIELTAPNNGPTVTLLNNLQYLDGAGTTQTQNNYGDGTRPGLPTGTKSLGIDYYIDGNQQLTTRSFGLVFDQQAARQVNDPANLAPYILRVRPEIGSLSQYNGLTAAQLTGNWTLRITNYKVDDSGTPAPPSSRLAQWDLKFVSRVNTTGFGTDRTVTDGFNTATTTVSTPGLTGNTANTVLPTAGIQGWYSTAVDDSKGSFSPFQGRTYLAVSSGSAINLWSSDNGGTTWNSPVQVNDDSSSDGFSTGTRLKFQPTVTVDRSTGTVVVMWYDARWDASNSRVANFIATSVDGGQTFSPNTFLNPTKTATNAIDGKTVKLEPIPTNLSGITQFGNHSGLVALGGVVVPVFVGNTNGVATSNSGNTQLQSAQVRIGTGPRVLQGDMGPVTDDFTIPGVNGVVYNNTFAIDGTRQVNAFYVRFDRNIDPATFTTSDVRLLYKDTTGAAAQDISLQVLSVTALDLNLAGTAATRFLVRITPQSKVGTYSYAVGSNIRDNIRLVDTRAFAPNTDFPPTLNTGNNTATSTIVIVNQPTVASVTALQVMVDFTGGGFGGASASDLILRLIGPAGQVVTLARQNGGNTSAATAYTPTTTFDDIAGQSVSVAPTPYGTVQPLDSLLTAFGALTDINGSWRLQVVNLGNGSTNLSMWSLKFNGSATTFAPPGSNLPVAVPSTPQSSSALVVSGVAINTQITTLQVGVKFSDPAAVPANASDLLLRLVGRTSNGFGGTTNRTITLSYANGTGTAGTAYATAVFDDNAATSVTVAVSPFGNVQPIDSLLAAFGGAANLYDPNGTWTLQVYDLSTGTARTLQLDTWSLTLIAGGVTSSFSSGFPVTIPGGGQFTQTQTLTAQAPINLSNFSVNVEFTNPAASVGNASDVRVRLIGPAGQSVLLTNGGGLGTAGTAFRFTTFQDGAGIPTIAAMNGVNSVVNPFQSLMGTFGALTDINGTWTIEVTNLSTNRNIRFNNWELVFQGTASTGNMQQQSAGGTANTVVRAAAGTSNTWTTAVANQPAPAAATTVRVNVQFADPNAVAAQAADLRLTLTGPNGQTVVLANANGGTALAGTAFADTTFADGAAAIGASGPYGLVAPAQSLAAAFANIANWNGNWTLTVTNLSTGRTLELASWSLTLNGTKFDVNTGNQFSNPNPTGGTPFVLPYATDSLPLIIPGPQLVSSTPVLTKDAGVSAIDVTFDRDINAATFNPAQVVELRTPDGTIVSSGFAVTANPAGTPAALARRVFRVTFPAQFLNGSYALVLGSGITSTSGAPVDANQNAGVDLLTGKVTNPTVAGTVLNAYNTGTVNVSVPLAVNASTPAVVTSTLAIPDAFVITQLAATPITVRLTIRDADVRDLTVRLVAPDGTAVNLFTNVGNLGLNSYADFISTTFSDFAPPANTIQTGSPPFTGSYLAQQQLTTFNGLASAGGWRLEITNRSTTNTATLVSWGLSLPKPLLGTGLGETLADRSTVSFRIFTAGPSTAQATTNWTPIGPNAINSDGGFGNITTVHGVVTASATDPSDPSGNTVFVGTESGGLWKTTNFLTTAAGGPTWIALTDNGTGNSLRISTIAILPSNNDPQQNSTIFVGTGEADTQSAGVGLLRSTDGGRTFRLIDSTNNADAAGNILAIASASRNHLFALNATYVYKIAVDPVRLTDGNVAVYAALGGSAATQGLWRSLDSGRSWTRIMTGECTDIVLAQNRVDIVTVNGVDTPTRRVADIAYAAFSSATSNGGPGVYYSPLIASTGANTMQLINGGVGKPLFNSGSLNTPSPSVAVGNLGTNPNGTNARILLMPVVPPSGSNPLTIRIYQGWLYALVTGGASAGLYQTKDFGQNWVRMTLGNRTVTVNGTVFYFPGQSTNDETSPIQYQFGVNGGYNSLTVDPTNPNVVYVGGTTGISRLDFTAINDAHAEVTADHSAGGVGAQAQTASSTGGISNGDGTEQFLNRMRDPNNPFLSPASQTLPSADSKLALTFVNNGFNVQASQFADFFPHTTLRNIETVTDPLTGKTRLIVSTDDGVYTTVDGADPLPTQGLYANASSFTQLGSATLASGDRSGNLSLTEGLQTAIQPSELSADLTGLFNFVRDGRPLADQNSTATQWIHQVSNQGFINPSPGVIATPDANYGNLDWTGELQPTQGFPATPNPLSRLYGYVQTDPQGSGTIYEYRIPSVAGSGGGVTDAFGNSTDIFLVARPGQAPIGRTNGLFQAGDTATVGQWAGSRTAYFAVDPSSPDVVAINAPGSGRVFYTSDQGITWQAIGEPTSSPLPNPSNAVRFTGIGTAMAFGGKPPINTNTGTPNTFIYNGTDAGRLYVTTDAAVWTDITGTGATAITGGPILKISADPRPGQKGVFVLTPGGVFYKADGTTAAGGWTRLSANHGAGGTATTTDLFGVNTPLFGEVTTTPLLTPNGLLSMAVDWRYNTPVVYVGGTAGVFRTTNSGASWSLFPSTTDGAAQPLGQLPHAPVTDLELGYGDLNSSGVPNQTAARNVLVATTYGRGTYVIHLDAVSQPAGLNTSGPFVATATRVPTNANTGVASITLTFGTTATPIRVDAATLIAANVLLTSPSGAAIPFTVTDLSTGTASNVFRLDFSPTVAGTYSLTLTTNVRDTSGRRLNQNQNATNGEVPADNYVTSFSFTANQPPTVTALPNQGLLVNASSGPIAFTIGDDVTPVGNLSVTAVSSNTAVLPNGNIVLGGTGANRTVTVTPTGTGVATVTVTVTDASGRATAVTFDVSAVPAPTLPFADDFNRAGAPNLGAQWVVRSGSAAGSNNSALATSATAIATVTGITQLNSVSQASFTLPTSGTSTGGLVARYSGPAATANMYVGQVVFELGTITARLLRIVNGVPVELARSVPLASAGQYLLRLEVVNDSLKLFLEGSLVAYAFDTTVAAAGETGVRVDGGNRADDFSDANIALLPVVLPAAPTFTAVDTFTQTPGAQLSRSWRDRLGNITVSAAGQAIGQAGVNVSTYNVPNTADAGAQVDVAFTAAGQYAGIVLRYAGTPAAPDQNQYWGALQNLGGGQQSAQIWVNVNGGWTNLSSTTVAGTGGTLRFEASGTSVKLFLNNVLVSVVYDASLPGAGGVGLRTTAGAVVDNFAAFATSATAALAFSDAFTSNGTTNQLSPLWTQRAGSFTLAGNTAQGQNAGANTATLNGVSAADVVVTAVVQPQSGATTGLGLVARYTGTADGNMYWGALNVYGGNYLAQIWKNVGGAWSVVNLNSIQISVASAVGKTLRFEVIGTSLKLFLDDIVGGTSALISYANDASITGPGSVGVRIAGTAAFDDFTAAPLTALTPTLPFSDTFAANPPRNTLSRNWLERSGTFSVAGGQAAGQAGAVPNLAVLNGNTALADATVAADLFFTGAGQTAGLVLRYQGTNGTGDQNFYFADLVTQANGDALVRIRRDVNGAKTTLQQQTVAGYFPGANFAPAVAPRLQFRVLGNTLSVFLDNLATPLFSVTDSTFATGSAGIRTGSGSAVDNFTSTSP